MTTIRLVEGKNYEASRVEFGDEKYHVSKSSDVSYKRIPIRYDGGRLLLKTPTCKSFGIRSSEMDSGYTRRTMPLIFGDFQSDEQARFSRIFSDIARIAYEKLFVKGYQEERLKKLDSCFWRDEIFYAGIVESMYDSRLNTRYFIDGKEVGAKEVSEGMEYDAVAAILVDSIYVGEKTISIQAKLYEVTLSTAKKRDRVL